MIKGFVIGGFRPFHKGHEALIEYAKSNCDHLTILVGAIPGEPIHYKYRLKWVLSTYLDDPKVDVFADLVTEPEFKNSTEKSKWWGNYVTQKYGNFDRVFTSESYGSEFANAMNAENWVFNQSRTIIPISATMIRSKPLTYWNYLNNFAKDYFVKKIVILGTESTGKTTLAKQLAKHYNTQWCREVGRDLISDTKDCTIDDLKLVGFEHAKEIIKQSRLSNKLLFVDTDLSITKSYSEYLFGKVPEFPSWVEKANEMDMYIWLDSEGVPYIQDGTRLSKSERKFLEANHKRFINSDIKEYHTINYQISLIDSYQLRFEKIVRIIDKYIENL